MMELRPESLHETELGSVSCLAPEMIYLKKNVPNNQAGQNCVGRVITKNSTTLTKN